MATKTYDLKQVTVNFLGIPLDELGGWGEGGGCEVEFSADTFTDKVGADGETVRSPIYDDRATVKLILLQTAGANAVLSTIWNADKAAPNGAGVGPILVRDRLGLSVISGAQAWIMGPPKAVSYKGMAENLEWLIRIGSTKAFLGGN